MKKFFRIVSRTIAVLVFLYMFLGFLVVPAVLAWAIKDQGTKLLKHPVQVRGVQFNPILLSLHINGLQVLDAQGKAMAGFERFTADVSFLSLLKKEYRVELVSLDGLAVNVELLPDGHINLMELVPAPVPAAVPASTSPAVESKPAVVQPLPPVLVDLVILKNSSIRFTDKGLSPQFTTQMHAMDLKVTGISTKSDAQVRALFKAKLDEQGALSVETLVKPFVQPLEMETAVSLNGYALDVLTPYTGKYTGHKLKDGKLDIKMDYRIANNKLNAAHKVLVQRFEFGDKVQSKDALNLPFGLAVALLEDPQGRINISLPVKGDMNSPEFEYFHLIGQVVRNFFLKLMTKPFSMLASILPSDSGTDEMGSVRFVPGKAEFTAEEHEKIRALIAALKERPKLKLEINGTYDPALDWKAIKTEVFSGDFLQLKKESTREEAWVYRELYQRRFGIRAVWDLSKKYRAKDGTYDETGLNAEIKRRIIEDAPPDTTALNVLAQTRAKTVYDALLADGFDTNRISVGQLRAVESSMGYVPLEFTLTVFGEAPAAK